MSLARAVLDTIQRNKAGRDRARRNAWLRIPVYIRRELEMLEERAARELGDEVPKKTFTPDGHNYAGDP